MCVHILPFSRELRLLSHFPPLATARAEERMGSPGSYRGDVHEAVWHKLGGRCRRAQGLFGSCALQSEQPAEDRGLRENKGLPGCPPPRLCHMANRTVSGGTSFQRPALSPSSARRGFAPGAVSPPPWPGPGTSQRSPWCSECTGPGLARPEYPGSGHCRVSGGRSGEPPALPVPTAGSTLEFPVPPSPISLIPSSSQKLSLLDAVGNEQVGILPLIQ